MPNLKISQFSVSPGIDSSSIFAGLQTISGIVKDAIYTPSNILSYVNSQNSSLYPTIVASNLLTAQTSTQNIVTYIPASNGTFQVSSNINLTAVSSSSVIVSISFTDIHGNTVNQNLGSSSVTGFVFNSIYSITAKGGTQILIKSTVTGSSIAYDSFASLVKLLW